MSEELDLDFNLPEYDEEQAIVDSISNQYADGVKVLLNVERVTRKLKEHNDLEGCYYLKISMKCSAVDPLDSQKRIIEPPIWVSISLPIAHPQSRSNPQYKIPDWMHNQFERFVVGWFPDEVSKWEFLADYKGQGPVKEQEGLKKLALARGKLATELWKSQGAILKDKQVFAVCQHRDFKDGSVFVGWQQFNQDEGDEPMTPKEDLFVDFFGSVKWDKGEASEEEATEESTDFSF